MDSELREESKARRGFLKQVSRLFMAAGLISGYGAFAAIAARFIYPARPTRRDWLFVVDLGSVDVGDSFTFQSPSGQLISIARMGVAPAANSFVALSSVCPHLGCRVHWEAQNDRFFCPCHHGAFDAAGVAVLGPPMDAGQTLSTFPLKVEKDLLFIEVPCNNLHSAQV